MLFLYNMGDFVMQTTQTATFISTSSLYSAFTDANGNIIQSDYSGQRQIGVSIEKYKALEETATQATSQAEKYYQRLVELGDITPPITTEQRLDMLAEKLNQVMSMLTEKQKQELSDGHSGSGKVNTSRK